MLTPQEVAEHGFSKAHVGGYNMKEVDDFLDQVTEDYGALHKENAVLKGKIKVLAEKISEYRETEEAMRTTLLAAQKMANSMIVQAEEKKKRMLADAEREVAESEGRLAAAQVSVQQFVDQVQGLVRREGQFLEQLPNLKGEAIKAAMLKVTKLAPPPKPKPVPTAQQTLAEQPNLEGEKTMETPTNAAETDSINQLLQEELEPKQAVPEPPREKQDIPEGEFAAELAVPAQQAADEVDASQIDFTDLKFGKDYEIQ